MTLVTRTANKFTTAYVSASIRCYRGVVAKVLSERIARDRGEDSMLRWLNRWFDRWFDRVYAAAENRLPALAKHRGKSSIPEGMFEGLKRDWYRRILINHSQVPAALAAERAKTESWDEIERHIELWGRYDVHHTCDCGVPLGVWKQMVDPQC